MERAPQIGKSLLYVPMTNLILFFKLDIFFEGVGSGGGMHCGPPCVVFTRETFCHGSGSYFNYFCREMPLNSMV